MGQDFDRAIFGQIKANKLFGALADEELSALIAESRLWAAAGGTVLFRQGEQADCFFLLLRGHVQLFLEEDGVGRSILEISGPGELFCQAAALGNCAYPFGGEVLDSALLFVVTGDRFRQCLENRFDLVPIMLAQTAGRLRGLVHQLTELKMKTAAQRLAGFLLTLTEAETGAVEVAIPFDKRLIADKLGMKPETLSRAFNKLQQLGVGKGSCPASLRLGDLAALRRFCHAGND